MNYHILTSFLILILSSSSYAQFNFWHSMKDNCQKSAISCLAHFNNNCKKDGIYLVNNTKVNCSMTTGGGQLISSSALDISKVQSGKQYVTIPAGVTGDQAGINAVASGVRVSEIYSIANPKINLTVGKSAMFTTSTGASGGGTSCHPSPTLSTCYNYIQEINAFFNRQMDQNDFGIIVFGNANKTVGKITATNEGYDGNHAYIYFRIVPSTVYSVYELL